MPEKQQATQKIRFNYGILCNDIRKEDNGKLILIGVYGYNAVVKTFPAHIQFRYALNITSKEVGKSSLAYEIINSDKNVLARGKAEFEFKKADKMTFVALPPFSVAFSKATDLIFRFREGTGRWKVISITEVRLEPTPSPTA